MSAYLQRPDKSISFNSCDISLRFCGPPHKICPGPSRCLIPSPGCYAHLDKLRKNCNDLDIELHPMGQWGTNFCYTQLEWKGKNNSHRRINRSSEKIFRCHTPAYPLLKTRKLTPENSLNIDVKHMPYACYKLLVTSAPHALLHFCNSYRNLLLQSFAKTAYVSLVKIAVSALETCSIGKTASIKHLKF